MEHIHWQPQHGDAPGFRYIIRNDSQDAWLSGRVWYAHKSYADKFADRDEADEVATIMENAFPNDRIRVIPC